MTEYNSSLQEQIDQLAQALEKALDEKDSLSQQLSESEQTVQYLTERIESLSESDLQLQSVQQEK